MKLEDINTIRNGLEEKFIAPDGTIKLVFKEGNHFVQYRVASKGVYIFEKDVSVDGNQLELLYD